MMLQLSLPPVWSICLQNQGNAAHDVANPVIVQVPFKFNEVYTLTVKKTFHYLNTM